MSDKSYLEYDEQEARRMYQEEFHDTFKTFEEYDEFHRAMLGAMSGNETMASLPGGIKINFFRYFFTNPRPIFIYFLVITVASLLMIWVAQIFFWIVLIAAICLIIYVRALKNMFLYGNCNAAYVISTKPTLIAVLGNLSKGDDDQDYLAVKIIRSRLTTSRGLPLKRGSRLVAVALYEDADKDGPAWSDFSPKPLDYATGDKEKISSVLMKVPKEDWEELKRLIKSLKTKSLGLHKFWDVSE